MPMCASNPSTVRVSGRPSDPGVVHQYVNGVHGLGELADTGQVREIQIPDFDVAGHLGSGLLGLRNRSAGDHHPVTGGGQRRSRRLADAAVAAGDDGPHRPISPATIL